MCPAMRHKDTLCRALRQRAWHLYVLTVIAKQLFADGIGRRLLPFQTFLSFWPIVLLHPWPDPFLDVHTNYKQASKQAIERAITQHWLHRPSTTQRETIYVLVVAANSRTQKPIDIPNPNKTVRASDRYVSWWLVFSFPSCFSLYRWQMHSH